MSLVEQYHAEHKARLARMGQPVPYQPKLIQMRKEPPPKPEYIKPESYYPQFWMYDVVKAGFEGREVTIAAIKNVVCKFHFVSMSELVDPGRGSAELVHVRHIAMYLCRRLLQASWAKIGRAFGGRDHTTIIHAYARIEDKIAADQEFAGHITRLERELLG